MKFLFPLLTLTILAACGADGAPERPTAGVTISGEASVGVTGSN